MDLFEYKMQMKAYALKRVDKEHDMHQQAWLIVQAGSRKTQGDKEVSAYKNFKAFYDYDKRIKEVSGQKTSAVTNQMRRMAQAAKRINAERR